MRHLREIVTLFRHVGNLQVSLCKYGFFVMFLICYHYFQWILEGVSKGGQRGVSRGSVDRGSVFCRSPNIVDPYTYTHTCAARKCMGFWRAHTVYTVKRVFVSDTYALNGRLRRKSSYTWDKNPYNLKNCKYTWAKTAHIPCHNFETNGRP